MPNPYSLFPVLSPLLHQNRFGKRDVRTGRAETVQMWGRTESVRQEFRKLNAL